MVIQSESPSIYAWVTSYVYNTIYRYYILKASFIFIFTFKLASVDCECMCHAESGRPKKKRMKGNDDMRAWEGNHRGREPMLCRLQQNGSKKQGLLLMCLLQISICLHATCVSQPPYFTYKIIKTFCCCWHDKELHLHKISHLSLWQLLMTDGWGVIDD